MLVDRRSFLQSVLAGATAFRALARTPDGLKIGVTDWNLRLTGKTEAVALAAKLGFDGVQISLGRKPVAGKLPLAEPAIQARYVVEANEYRIPIDGTCLDILHVDHLKNNRQAQKWVSEGIEITSNVKTVVMLLPFFGPAAITKPAEMDYVADVLKELAPDAEKAGVILGLEDTISAEDNVRIMERAGSNAVKVYYDVGNSTEGGFDVVKEIRWLGAQRICQIHLKDNPHYLGEGKIDFPAVIKAITDIHYKGFANLETDCPSQSVENDMARNLKYVRGLLAA
jgi:L-ribulose-5-phosphate 3-epimerase